MCAPKRVPGPPPVYLRKCSILQALSGGSPSSSSPPPGLRAAQAQHRGMLSGRAVQGTLCRQYGSGGAAGGGRGVGVRTPAMGVGGGLEPYVLTVGVLGGKGGGFGVWIPAMGVLGGHRREFGAVRRGYGVLGGTGGGLGPLSRAMGVLGGVREGLGSRIMAMGYWGGWVGVRGPASWLWGCRGGAQEGVWGRAWDGRTAAWSGKWVGKRGWNVGPGAAPRGGVAVLRWGRGRGPRGGGAADPPPPPSPPSARSVPVPPGRPVPSEPRLAAPAPVPSWRPFGRLAARLKPSSAPSLRAALQRGPDCSECRVSHVFFSFWTPPCAPAGLSPSDPAASKGPAAPHPPAGHGKAAGQRTAAAGSGSPPPDGRPSPAAGGGRWAQWGRAPAQRAPQLRSAAGWGAALGGGVRAWGGGTALPSLHGGPGGAPSPSPFRPSSSCGGAESWGCGVGSSGG